MEWHYVIKKCNRIPLLFVVNLFINCGKKNQWACRSRYENNDENNMKKDMFLKISALFIQEIWFYVFLKRINHSAKVLILKTEFLLSNKTLVDTIIHFNKIQLGHNVILLHSPTSPTLETYTIEK